MASTASPIRNVIVMIADGAGYNTLQATRYYLQGLADGDARAGAAGRTLVADGPLFSATAQSTYPLDTRTTPVPGAAGTAQNPATVYDPARNYDFTRVTGTDPNGQPRAFAGYDWNRATYPDSGNTASAIATGQKTYNNAIDVDGNGLDAYSLAQEAKALGKSTGVVTTVQFSDATPAALGGAHDISRANANDIALEMFSTGVLDVIGGTGNPDYDDNGRLRATANYQWIGQNLWNQLKADTYRSQDGQSWDLLQDRAAIQAAGTGTPTAERLAMITQAFTSGNFNRDGAAAANTTEVPFSVPRLANTPTLSELSLAALNKLGTDPDGLYLMIEGGAVDRAMHANNQGRMIEEYVDFNNAVKSVVDWVNRPDTAATFENTLLVVTADHDHLYFGPEGATVPFQPVQPDRNGDGVPEGLFFSTNHSNQIVPLLTAGPGSAQIGQLADQIDSAVNAQGQTVGSGRAFTDQAELGNYLLASLRLGATPLTEGNDNLVGTEAGDAFNGLGGNDVMDGRGGNDVLTGGAGNDLAAGGTGNDLVYGNLGNDTLYGNQGSDLLFGGQGNDLVYGGQDDDRLYGNLGNDRLFGNRGNDLVYGNQGDDLIYGNQGTDVLYGGQGNDTLYGGQDNDLLAGGLGNDVLVGGAGADLYVFGANSGRDLVIGFNQAQGDRIRLSGQTYTLSAAQNGDAVLALSGGGTVDLAGVRVDQVGAGYFVA